MCIYCGKKSCFLTKEQAVNYGPILEDETCGIGCASTNDTPQTYVFTSFPEYLSGSALIPDKGNKNPHAYLRYIYDQKTCEGEWIHPTIIDPLNWFTEKELLELRWTILKTIIFLYVISLGSQIVYSLIREPIYAGIAALFLCLGTIVLIINKN
jgi:hypothetical protein